MRIDDGRCDAALWVPSPNFDEGPEGVAIELLVIHNISLAPGEFGGERDGRTGAEQGQQDGGDCRHAGGEEQRAAAVECAERGLGGLGRGVGRARVGVACSVTALVRPSETPWGADGSMRHDARAIAATAHAMPGARIGHLRHAGL